MQDFFIAIRFSNEEYKIALTKISFWYQQYSELLTRQTGADILNHIIYTAFPHFQFPQLYKICILYNWLYFLIRTRYALLGIFRRLKT